MRTVLIGWTIILITLLSACFRETVQPTEFELPATPHEPYLGELVFEIRNEWKGMSYMKGEILDFRLFTDGTIEFDDYPTDEEMSATVKASDVAKRKRFSISSHDVADLRTMITRPEFLRLKPEYKKLTSSCDAAYDRTIISEKKSVRIPQWCGPNKPPEFPQEIFELFLKVREIKKEKLGKDLPTP